MPLTSFISLGRIYFFFFFSCCCCLHQINKVNGVWRKRWINDIWPRKKRHFWLHINTEHSLIRLIIIIADHHGVDIFVMKQQFRSRITTLKNIYCKSYWLIDWLILFFLISCIFFLSCYYYFVASFIYVHYVILDYYFWKYKPIIVIFILSIYSFHSSSKKKQQKKHQWIK